jgi:transmembrane protein TMEM260 (protein O-mannosyltransferase)
MGRAAPRAEHAANRRGPAHHRGKARLLIGRRLLAAGLVALIAFLVYRATLLPGFDFGDTGSFQTTVGESQITPRDAYPLYFAVGAAFVRLSHIEPARALNLLSAVEGAIAAGLVVLVASELSGSLLAGVAAAALFAASYTFWSQAVIAEVYALHAVFVAMTLWLLLRWSIRPTPARLAVFFGAYALGFGNHLSMVLLLPGFTLFLLIAAPHGWRSMLSPRIVALAAACACAGALQYAWNVRGLWFAPHPPDSIADALQTFWFDVTKSDWRDTMVMQVPSSVLSDRLAMYWFDVRQQFGPLVPLVAAVGLAGLFRVDARRGLLMLLLYAVNALFAFGYNVGDAHVFFLPSHLIIALLVAPAIVVVRRAGPQIAVAIVLIAYAAARGYHDFPALDRSGDRRPTAVVDRLTAGVDDQRALLLTDLNWQIANGLSYFAKVVHPEVVAARMPDVLLYAPALIGDNLAIGRRVFVTERARKELADAYGSFITTTDDATTIVPPLTSEIRDVPPGTRYAISVLRPSRDVSLNHSELDAAFRLLTGGESVPAGDYVAVIGTVGRSPALVAASSQPFTRRVTVEGVDVEVRMDAWLASDTIRRMGFGHVIGNRQHTLIVERGVSFAAFDDRGRAIRTAYRANIFAPQPRYLCYR